MICEKLCVTLDSVISITRYDWTFCHIMSYCSNSSDGSEKTHIIKLPGPNEKNGD